MRRAAPAEVRAGGFLARALLALLVVCAPLYLGGNRPPAMLVLELAGLALLVALSWEAGFAAAFAGLPASLKAAIAILVAYPLAQCVPLPASWWAQIPGHGPHAAALAFAGPEALASPRPLSLHPRATEYSWLVLLPCLAAFLAIRLQPRRWVRRFMALFVAVAVGEAILGLLQLGAGPGSPLHLGIAHGGGFASGTYVNRNHFAALMAMALPCALVLWYLETRPPGTGSGGLLPHPKRADRRRAQQLALAVPVLLLIVALVFSLSRGGIGSGLAAFALASMALVSRALPVGPRILYALIGGGALALGAYIGFTPVLDRFAPDAFAGGFEGRLLLAATSFRAGLEFLPFGSGLGTFADAFQHFQPEALAGYVDHAHNDYAELFLELGVAGVAIAALFLAAYLGRWHALGREGATRSLDRLRMAAGLGMAAMLVHGLVDFNFHIPANAIYFSFLAGVFFHLGSDPN